MKNCKKLIALTLVLALSLGATVALAESSAAIGELTEFAALGATIQIPEGMTLVEDEELLAELDTEDTIAFIADAEGNKAVFSWVEDESLGAIELTEMSPEETAEEANKLIAPFMAKTAAVLSLETGVSYLTIAYDDEEGVERGVMALIVDGTAYTIRFQNAEGYAADEAVNLAFLQVVSTLTIVDEGEGE